MGPSPAPLSLDIRLLMTAEEYIEDLDVSADGRRVVAASVSGQVLLAELDGPRGTAGGAWRSRTIATHAAEASRARFSPDATSVATASNDATMVVRDLDGAPLHTVTGEGWARDLAWRPDGNELAVAIGREVHRLAPDGTKRPVHRDHPTTVECLAWTNDGRHLGVGTYGGVWWYQGDPRPLRRFEWKGALLSLTVSPDDGWAASGNQDASVHCWRLWKKGDELEMTGYPTKVQHLAWDTSSKFLAVGNLGEVTVWSFTGRGPKGTTPLQFGAHERHIVGLAYRPTGGDVLASVSADGLLCLWRPLSDTRSPAVRLDLGVGPTSLRWSPSGERLLIGTDDGGVLDVMVSEMAT